ncbi:MAG: ARPP-1 family domain-containing protein [Ilumatobacteraceae bacterium]
MRVPLNHPAVGRPITRVGISFMPVYVPGAPDAAVSAARDDVAITELDDEEVPHLTATNSSGRPVLLTEGETVNGGRQNRVLNTSVLIPAATTLKIPVSCVEQGRWNTGHSFERSGWKAPRRVRRATSLGVVASAVNSGTKSSDQHQVWAAVHDELARLEAHNTTSDLDAARHQARARNRMVQSAVDELISAGPLSGQRGVIVFHGARLVAFEYFGTDELLRDHWAGLISAHMLDATRKRSSQPSATRALSFLHHFAERDHATSPGVGLGWDAALQSRRYTGQALVWDSSLIHASVFALAA